MDSSPLPLLDLAGARRQQACAWQFISPDSSTGRGKSSLETGTRDRLRHKKIPSQDGGTSVWQMARITLVFSTITATPPRSPHNTLQTKPWDVRHNSNNSKCFEAWSLQQLQFRATWRRNMASSLSKTELISRPSSRWGYDIKNDLKRIICEDVDLIHIACEYGNDGR